MNIGVLLALALSYYGYLWADGLFASLIGLFIMKGAYVIGFRAVQTLLDKSLGRDSIKKIINAIHSIGDVKSVHDLKTHRAGPMVYIQGHLVLDGNMDLFKAHDIVDEIEKKIRIDFPDAEIILHMEPDTQSTYEDVVFFDSAEDKTE